MESDWGPNVKVSFDETGDEDNMSATLQVGPSPSEFEQPEGLMTAGHIPGS